MKLFNIILLSLWSFSSSVTIPSTFILSISSMIRSGTKASPNNKYLAAILMAIDELNNKTDKVYDNILPKTQFRIMFKEDTNTFINGAGNGYFNLNTASSVIANIGAFTTKSSQGFIPVYGESKIPVIGFRDRSAIFGDSSYYPNFLRTIPGQYQDGYAVASLISKYFVWDKVVLFSSNSQVGRASANVFRYYADKYDIQVFSSYSVETSTTDFSDVINFAKKFGSRIFVLFVEPQIAVNLIDQGKKLKLFSSDTQIIGGELLSLSTSWNSLNVSSTKLNDLLRGFIGVKYVV